MEVSHQLIQESEQLAGPDGYSAVKFSQGCQVGGDQLSRRDSYNILRK